MPNIIININNIGNKMADISLHAYHINRGIQPWYLIINVTIHVHHINHGWRFVDEELNTGAKFSMSLPLVKLKQTPD